MTLTFYNEKSRWYYVNIIQRKNIKLKTKLYWKGKRIPKRGDGGRRKNHRKFFQKEKMARLWHIDMEQMQDMEIKFKNRVVWKISFQITRVW